MNTNKCLFVLIIFFTVLPCRSLFAQEVDETDTVQSELDIRYDSILAKATSALTANDYQRAINFYKEAGTIKENDTYAYKMIRYVEELAAKQKRADELKRKALIKDGLIKANQAVAEKKWDSAKVYYSQVLALQPDKADDDFARSKVAAIDLELQRIVVRTPVKETPKPAYVPKTRREIREQKKLEERNAIMAASAQKAMEQQQFQTKSAVAPSAKTRESQAGIASSSAAGNGATINYELLRHFNEDFRNATNINWSINADFAKVEFLVDDEKVEAFYDLNGLLVGTSRYISVDQVPKEARRIFATRFPQYAISEVIRYEGAEDVAYYISTSDNKEKVVFKLVGSKDINIFSRSPLSQNIVSNTNVPKAAPQKTLQSVAPKATTTAANTSTAPAQTQPTRAQVPVAAGSQSTAATVAPQSNRAQAPTIGNRSTAATSQAEPNRTSTLQNSVTTAPPQPNRIPATSSALSPSLTTPPASRQPQHQPIETSVAASNAAGRINGATAKPIDTMAKSGGVTASNTKAATTHSTNLSTLPPANNTGVQKSVRTTTPSGSEPVISLPASGLTEIPAEMPGLKLSDSSNYVKLICQDISFIGSNAYIKVLIQNANPTDSFQTDTLHVSVVKNNGVVKRLDQRFVSNFPVVRPMQELVLVSLSDASAGVDPSDVFIIEMKDKTKNTKFSIQVPWRVYAQTKNL